MIGDLDLDTIRERLGGDARAPLDDMIAERRVVVVNADTLDVQSAVEYLTTPRMPDFILTDLTEPAQAFTFPEVRPTRQARQAAERQQRKGARVG